jgi:hypothetical protein
MMCLCWLQVTGVTCTVIITRYTAQWVMSAILPIVASTWLGFVVFLLPRYACWWTGTLGQEHVLCQVYAKSSAADDVYPRGQGTLLMLLAVKCSILAT